MNQEKYDYQKLQAYLLGELSGADEERFDELSFTDEGFAATLETTENDLLDAYANGEMDTATREKFESVYRASSRRREKIEFAKAFQSFVEKNQNSATLLTESKPGETAGGFSLRNFFKNQNSFWHWGLAAAALAVLFFGSFWLLNFNRRQTELARQTNTPAPKTASPTVAPTTNTTAAIEPPATTPAENINSSPKVKKKPPSNQNAVERKAPPEKLIAEPPKSVVAFVLTPPLRGGASNIPIFSIPKNAARAVSVRLQLETDDYAAYRVALADQNGKQIWSGSNFKAKSGSEMSTLSIRFPANLLKTQIFSLVVSGVKSNGEVEIIGDYPFRAVVK